MTSCPHYPGTTPYRRPARLLSLLILPLMLGSVPFRVAGQTPPLSSERQAELISEVLVRIQEIYPFPEIAGGVTAGMRENLNRGRYRSFTDPEEFAQRVSADLGELSNDAHLGLTFDPPRAREMTAYEEEGLENPYAASTLEAERWNNFGFKELRILEGNVGYLESLQSGSVSGVHVAGYLSSLDDGQGVLGVQSGSGGGSGEVDR